jgi:hypothetical protein
MISKQAVGLRKKRLISDRADLPAAACTGDGNVFGRAVLQTGRRLDSTLSRWLGSGKAPARPCESGNNLEGHLPPDEDDRKNIELD